jgi:FkbM family methyltransferase
MKTGLRRLYSYLFARKAFYRLHLFLYFLALRGMGLFNYYSLEASGERHFLLRYLRERKQPVVFDVGANVGDYTAEVRALNPEARIICFEPHPKTFQTLVANAKNIEAHNVGVGSESGVLSFYDHVNGDGSVHASFVKGVIENIHHDQAVERTVPVTTLDEFCRANGIEEIDLLKIDTEGYELEVLKGARKLLQHARIGAIHFEFNEMNTVSRAFFKDFLEALPNYDIYRMLRDGVVSMNDYVPVTHEIFGFQNILALPKKAQ